MKNNERARTLDWRNTHTPSLLVSVILEPEPVGVSDACELLLHDGLEKLPGVVGRLQHPTYVPATPQCNIPQLELIDNTTVQHASVKSNWHHSAPWPQLELIDITVQHGHS